MSVINVNNNQVTYAPVKNYLQGSFNDQAGPNKFGRWMYYDSSPNTVQQDIQWYGILSFTVRPDIYGEKPTSLIKYTLTGTITKNIEDEILYYQMTDVGPTNDPTIIIPANPYSNVDNVSISFWKSADKANHIGLSLRVFAVTRNPEKAKQAVFKFNLTTNVYSY